MESQNPVDNDVAGEMHTGDLVVATEHGLYWVDATTRGGLLSGEWPLRDHNGVVNFSYIVGTHNWGPNLLLPGSNGSDAFADEGDEGLGIRLLPEGASDGSPVEGRGTFDPHGAVLLSSSGREGYEQIFRYTGTLTQEFNGTNVMVDNNGDTTQMKYEITYRFADANDPKTSQIQVPLKRYISDQYVNTIDVSLTPVNTTGSCVVNGLHCIHLSVFGIGDDLQFIPTAQSASDLYMLSTKTTLQEYAPTGCPNGSRHRPHTFVSLCTSTPTGDQSFIQESTVLPKSIPAGTETVFCASGCVRSLTYIHPAGFDLPARDASVYNRALNVIAVETQYFNTNDPVQTWYDGRSVRTAEEQLIQYF